ncbi:MAG: hypothetical protein CFH34_00223 [Alphaproteobacteria bacterium MarineAlpha9_Bin4]|nr:hypothetical protein [Pelagibacterales bacterium]PPR27394.1 MAG: hypothetical protein CFH34_00223 [Alphaproteobacteria bacterium MarineAlpha9_Bin4]
MFSYSKYNIFSINRVFSFLFIILILRIYSSYILDIPLHFDEAQYWGWSQKLDWGYFSKPPMLAWLIRLNTSFCGESEFCIRISTPILYFLSSIFVFLSTKLISQNNFLAGFSALVFTLIPGITFSSLISTTDVPLIFFSSIFSYLFLKIYKDRNTSYIFLILLGLIFGLGTLSKYAMFYLFISLVITSFLYIKVRKKFYNIGGLLFIFSFLILILPHLYWNYNNGFVTFNHTADNANFQKINFNAKELLLFFLSQFIVFGIYPLYSILGNSINIKALDEEKKILFIFFMTPLVIVSFIAFFSRANANWAVVGYPFGCILLAKILNEKENISKKIYALFSQIVLSVVVITLIFIGKVNNEFDPFAKQRYAKPLAKKISNEIIHLNNIAFMSDDREDFALMLYYLQEFKGKRAKWNGDTKIDDHYELTTNVNNLVGYNLLFLTRTAPTPEMINRSDSHQLIKSLTFKSRKKIKYYNLYLLNNWR